MRERDLTSFIVDLLEKEADRWEQLHSFACFKKPWGSAKRREKRNLPRPKRVVNGNLALEFSQVSLWHW